MAGSTTETASKPAAAAAPPVKEAATAKEAAAPSVEAREEVISLAGRYRPIVVNVKRGKRKKRKYSRGTKSLQVRGRRATKAGDRLLRAVSSGLGQYRRKSDKSSRKKRDGASRDLLKNIGSGIGKTLRKSDKVPRSIGKALQPKKKTTRSSLRRIGSLLKR